MGKGILGRANLISKVRACAKYPTFYIYSLPPPNHLHYRGNFLMTALVLSLPYSKALADCPLNAKRSPSYSTWWHSPPAFWPLPTSWAFFPTMSRMLTSLSPHRSVIPLSSASRTLFKLLPLLEMPICPSYTGKAPRIFKSPTQMPFILQYGINFLLPWIA